METDDRRLRMIGDDLPLLRQSSSIVKGYVPNPQIVMIGTRIIHSFATDEIETRFSRICHWRNWLACVEARYFV